MDVGSGVKGQKEGFEGRWKGSCWPPPCMDHAKARWGDISIDDPNTWVSLGRLGSWGTAAGVAAGIASHAWLSATADSQSDAAIWARHRGRLSEHMKKRSGRVREPKISG